MKHTDKETDTPQDPVKNYASKMLMKSLCDSVRSVLTACSPVNDTILTPEAVVELFEQAGISAGEEGRLSQSNPFAKHKEITEFGLLLAARWEIGRRAGYSSYCANRRAK